MSGINKWNARIRQTLKTVSAKQMKEQVVKGEVETADENKQTETDNKPDKEQNESSSHEQDEPIEDVGQKQLGGKKLREKSRKRDGGKKRIFEEAGISDAKKANLESSVDVDVNVVENRFDDIGLGYLCLSSLRTLM